MAFAIKLICNMIILSIATAIFLLIASFLIISYALTKLDKNHPLILSRPDFRHLTEEARVNNNQMYRIWIQQLTSFSFSMLRNAKSYKECPICIEKFTEDSKII